MAIKIEFSRHDGLEDPFPPVPANQILPDWYKEANSYWNDEKRPRKDRQYVTIKRCVPVLDSMSSGYLIRLSQDVYVEQLEDGPYFHWRTDAVNVNNALITEHGAFQVQKHPDNQYGYQLKIENPWLIKTPKGYSCMFLPPMHRDNDLIVLPGVVDTDSYYERVHFPFNLKDKKFEGMLKAGTPIVQVVPFKRESYKMVVKDPDTKLHKKNGMIASSNLFDAYRNNFWTRKEYR